MTTRPAWFYCAALLMIGCSDGTDPGLPPGGTFSAILTGVRQMALSGGSNAGPVYTELGTDFGIRMFADQGDVVHFVLIRCPGEEPPADGLHALGDASGGCTGSYALVTSSGFTTLEQMKASSGRVTIQPSGEEEVRGSFTFEGPLVVGGDTSGSVTAAGSFRAERIH